ncbi:hypothetical protein ACPC54_30365 [Kitasatospora sp. NPDC094028]
MAFTTSRDVVLSCSSCGAVEVLPPELVDPDDERATYKAACTWHKSKWAAGWRWLGSLNLYSCPACPKLLVEKDGVHVAGPGLQQPHAEAQSTP